MFRTAFAATLAVVIEASYLQTQIAKKSEPSGKLGLAQVEEKMEEDVKDLALAQVEEKMEEAVKDLGLAQVEDNG